MQSNYNPFSLEGKNILITGASSGIGRATAIECSKLGASVIVSGRNESRLKETISMLDGEGHSYFICDLSKAEHISTMVEGLPELDGFVSNAGTTSLNPINYYKEETIQEIFSVNAISPILLLKYLLKKKKIRRNSSVVYTSSIAGMGGAVIGNGIYTASKGAISSFIKVAALELASKGIRVNAVCPGLTNTHMIYDESLEDTEFKKEVERYPLKRCAEPQDIALGIVYLLSDGSSWVTGTNLIIDGGLTIL
jgi:NAD(P)-dependent dehydrogenase (short-subunit alcohol dehydrogenase family)